MSSDVTMLPFRASAEVGESGRAVNPLAMPEGVRFPPRPSYEPKGGNKASRFLRAALEAWIVERDGSYACFYCGYDQSVKWDRRRLMAIDHVIPAGWGGSDDVDNLVFACSHCNIRKALQPGWFFMLKTHVVRLADRPPNIHLDFGRFPLVVWALGADDVHEPPSAVSSLPEQASTQHLADALLDQAKFPGADVPEAVPNNKEKG